MGSSSEAQSSTTAQRSKKGSTAELPSCMERSGGSRSKGGGQTPALIRREGHMTDQLIRDHACESSVRGRLWLLREDGAANLCTWEGGQKNGGRGCFLLPPWVHKHVVYHIFQFVFSFFSRFTAIEPRLMKCWKVLKKHKVPNQRNNHDFHFCYNLATL